MSLHPGTSQAPAGAEPRDDTGAEPRADGRVDSAALARRLADPGVVASLTTLLDHADLLALLVESLDQFLSRSEVIGESVIAGIAELRQGSEASGMDVGGIASAGAKLAAALPQAAPQMVSAIESGAVEKLLATAEVTAEALPQVEMLAQSFVRGSERFATDPIEVGGPVSIVRLLRDPDINRALSYLATIAKSIGADLAAPATYGPPAAPANGN